MSSRKRAAWSEDDLQKALDSINNGMSISQASKNFSIPRSTLGLHFRKNNRMKRLGRKSVLTPEQEMDLVSRIHRLAEVGVPLTPKMVRRSVFSYTKLKNIPNPFCEISEMAGRKWLRLFFKRHPDVAKRRAQQMNPARAQKMNRFIISDYFEKLKAVMTKLELFGKPGNIYNIDEKGCRLTLHHQHTVLAKKGTKRVHLTAPEHGENVTIVGCGNALGQAIPPFVLFKGQRLKSEWTDKMPPGSKAMMTKKGSMTNNSFVGWLTHFAVFKNAGPTLLIFDGAAAHLDISIVNAADIHGVTLFCLPSNTTHELQPMDKAVFKSFESYRDEEVLRFVTTEPGKALTKIRFGEIFAKVWLKAMTPSNIISGFKATGIYPFDPEIIPDSAFAPSLITENANNKEGKELISTLQKTYADADISKPGTSGVKKIVNVREESTSEDNESDYSLHDSDSSVGNLDLEDDLIDDKITDDSKQEENNKNESFTESGLLVTPEVKISARKRKPAINSRAQEVTKDVFSEEIKSNKKNSKEENLKNKGMSNKGLKNKGLPKKRSKQTENWYCFLCNEDRVANMRLCVKCYRYVHEDCVGLTKSDKDDFICPSCVM